jgi:hypothetical protein
MGEAGDKPWACTAKEISGEFMKTFEKSTEESRIALEEAREKFRKAFEGIQKNMLAEPDRKSFQFLKTEMLTDPLVRDVCMLQALVGAICDNGYLPDDVLSRLLDDQPTCEAQHQLAVGLYARGLMSTKQRARILPGVRF